VVLSFLLISVDHRQNHLASVRNALGVIIYPLQLAVSLPVRLVDSVAETFSTRGQLMLDNDRLRDENLLLRSKVQRFNALEKENSRLRVLLDSSSDLGEEVVVAEVIAIETNARRRQIIINKGIRHHVYVGQPIADSDGILGQIAEVGRFVSTAILLTDARHAIPVQINRNGLRALATGDQEGEVLSLSFVPNNADVVVGDLVVSSGLDHRFPAGYPVGEVVEVNLETSEPFASIRVKPAAHIGRVREVLLVWPKPVVSDDAGPVENRPRKTVEDDAS
jgi:rod shape-determining protein MreC